MARPFQSNNGTCIDTRINRNGAPTLENQVRVWYNTNPDGSISQCARELAISRNTVRKWKPEANRENQNKSKLQRIWDILKE